MKFIFFVFLIWFIIWSIIKFLNRSKEKKREFVRYDAFTGDEEYEYQKVKNFCVIDFETANKYPDSVCSIGIVTVKNNTIVDRYHYYIKPPYQNFDNSFLHNITYEDVQNSPTFSELWPTIYPILNNNVVAAYNAKFDIGCLEATLKRYNLQSANYAALDILQSARYEWPDLKNHKLITVATSLGISYQQHNALSDAEAAALVLINANVNNEHHSRLIYRKQTEDSYQQIKQQFISGNKFFYAAKDKATALNSTNENDYAEVFELLKKAEQASEPCTNIAAMYRFWGEIYEKCNNIPNAISCYENALAHNEKIGVKMKLKKLKNQ